MQSEEKPQEQSGDLKMQKELVKNDPAQTVPPTPIKIQQESLDKVMKEK